MNDPVKRQPGGRGEDRDSDLLFWFWLPVIGAGTGLAFVLVGWWIGS